MTPRQRQEKISFELRLLRWRAIQRGYTLAELEQQLSLLIRRLGVDGDQAWVRAQITDFRAAMARELSP